MAKNKFYELENIQFEKLVSLLEFNNIRKNCVDRILVYIFVHPKFINRNKWIFKKYVGFALINKLIIANDHYVLKILLCLEEFLEQSLSLLGSDFIGAGWL